MATPSSIESAPRDALSLDPWFGCISDPSGGRNPAAATERPGFFKYRGRRNTVICDRTREQNPRELTRATNNARRSDVVAPAQTFKNVPWPTGWRASDRG